MILDSHRHIKKIALILGMLLAVGTVLFLYVNDRYGWEKVSRKKNIELGGKEKKYQNMLEAINKPSEENQSISSDMREEKQEEIIKPINIAGESRQEDAPSGGGDSDHFRRMLEAINASSVH